MPSETTTVLEANDRLIQFGCADKTAAECLIPFARRFDTPPRVVVTPFWEEAGRAVGDTETIDRVTEDDFVLFSNNAASNYFVSWIAVGYARGGRASHNVHFAQVGDLVLEMGAARAAATGPPASWLPPICSERSSHTSACRRWWLSAIRGPLNARLARQSA